MTQKQGGKQVISAVGDQAADWYYHHELLPGRGKVIKP